VNWVPTSERLPDRDGRYLVYAPAFGVRGESVVGFMYFSTEDADELLGGWHDGWVYGAPGIFYHPKDRPSHWAPIEPPTRRAAERGGEDAE
jgi:hypothetical protein